MKEATLKVLQENDEVLFENGACHVFAKCLFNELETRGYGLIGIRWELYGDQRRFSNTKHVACAKGNTLVHFHGVEYWQDYKKRMYDVNSAHQNFEKTQFRKFEITLNDLFTVADETEFRGKLNKWDYYIDEDFYEAAEKRAYLHIRNNRGKYRFS